MSRKNMPPGPGRPKGSKNKETIAKEERRAIFDTEMSKMFLDKVREARPEYLLDQFLGKSPDILELNAKIAMITDPEEREKARQILIDVLKRFNS